jgi:hypothetical protein
MAQINLGAVEAREGRFKEAEERYSSALSLCESVECGVPVHTALLFRYANVLSKLGRKDDARRFEARAEASRSGSRSRRPSMVDVRDLQHVADVAAGTPPR